VRARVRVGVRVTVRVRVGVRRARVRVRVRLGVRVGVRVSARFTVRVRVRVRLRVRVRRLVPCERGLGLDDGLTPHPTALTPPPPPQRPHLIAPTAPPPHSSHLQRLRGFENWFESRHTYKGVDEDDADHLLQLGALQLHARARLECALHPAAERGELLL
jgi:hypothetical protein